MRKKGNLFLAIFLNSLSMFQINLLLLLLTAKDLETSRIVKNFCFTMLLNIHFLNSKNSVLKANAVVPFLAILE